MSRTYDHGKNQYGQEHRAYAGQNACHQLSNDLLGHYGVSQGSYSAWAQDGNYRMGDAGVNGRDKRVDYMIRDEVFHNNGDDYRKGYYDAKALRGHGISNEQQLQRIGNRFDAAKEAYEQTGHGVYLKIQRDMRDIADNYLDADLRGFRISNKK